MRKIISILLIISFTFSACSHVIRKYENESELEYYGRINNLTANKDVLVKMNSGEVLLGKEILVNSDSTIINESGKNSLLKVATNEIISINISESERGGWEGFWFGTFAGGAAGVLSNYILPRGGHPSGNLLIIVYGALAGAVIGIVYGCLNESKTKIIIYGS